MKIQTTRLIKEARALLLPWCVACLAGILPLTHPPRWMAGFNELGFFFGIPLLAVLPFGNEFQYGTLSLLLSQPVDRMVIWREKMGVTVVAVLTASLIFSFSWWMAAIQVEPHIVALVALGVIVSITSANYWTLTAK